MGVGVALLEAAPWRLRHGAPPPSCSHNLGLPAPRRHQLLKPQGVRCRPWVSCERGPFWGREEGSLLSEHPSLERPGLTWLAEHVGQLAGPAVADEQATGKVP